MDALLEERSGRLPSAAAEAVRRGETLSGPMIRGSTPEECEAKTVLSFPMERVVSAMGSLLFTCTLALISVVGPSVSWVRFRSSLDPYTILLTPSFQHTVSGNADLFTPGPTVSAASHAALTVVATGGYMPGNPVTLLLATGGQHVHIVGRLHIAGQLVPLV